MSEGTRRRADRRYQRRWRLARERVLARAIADNPELPTIVETMLHLVSAEIRQWPTKETYRHRHWFLNPDAIGKCACGVCMHGVLDWHRCDRCTPVTPFVAYLDGLRTRDVQ